MPESSRRHHSHHAGHRSAHRSDVRTAQEARPRSSAGSSTGGGGGGGSTSSKLPRSSASEPHRSSTGSSGTRLSASARSLRSSGGSRTSACSGSGSGGYPGQVPSSSGRLTSREHDYIARHISDQLRTNYKTLYQAYQAIDMDRDGHINRSETRRFLTKQGFSTKVADQFYDKINPEGSKGVSYPTFQKQFHDGYELASYKDLASASQAVHSPTLLKVCTGAAGSSVRQAGKA